MGKKILVKIRNSTLNLNTSQTNKLLHNKSLGRVLLTVLVDEQGQVFSVVGADVKQQSRTLVRPEAQGDVLSSQGHVRVDGGRQGAAVPAQLVGLLKGVADGRL